MAQSHFEKLVEDEKRKTGEAMFSIAIGDSHRHAELKGVRQGLDKALELYRQASRTDVEQDDI